MQVQTLNYVENNKIDCLVRNCCRYNYFELVYILQILKSSYYLNKRYNGQYKHE